jgi:hypothetical protein
MAHKLHVIHDPCTNRIYIHTHTHKMVTTNARLYSVTRCDNSHLHRHQQTALFVVTCSPRTYWIVTACTGRVLRRERYRKCSSCNADQHIVMFAVNFALMRFIALLQGVQPSHRHCHKDPALANTLSQINPAHDIPFYCLTTYFNIILRSMPASSKLSEVLAEKPVPVPLGPPHISLLLAWSRPQASTATGRRPTG